MLKKILTPVFCLYCLFGASQRKDSLSIKNGIDNPSLLTTHHFGIFSSRINPNFKLKPPKNPVFTINYTSGNNFHPFLEAYFPKNPRVRQEQSRLPWYERDFHFENQQTTPADYLNIIIDAVIKEFRLSLNFALSKKHELGINLRSYLFTKGKQPFSPFTSDETIEWFHSNIHGGEDPFGRRFYGLNQLNFEYLDRNGNTLKFNKGDFFISGIEFNHFYYPDLALKDKDIFLNFGSHLGINTSKFNSSVDLGVSANIVKRIKLKGNYELNGGAGINFLRKNAIDFKETIDLGTNRVLATVQSDLEITKYTKRGHFNAFGVGYQIQTRYNRIQEFDYFRLLGNWRDIKSGWHHGLTTLYKAQSNWSFVYTYGHPNYMFSVFFKEDFVVNNAPDFQTGFSIKIPVFK